MFSSRVGNGQVDVNEGEKITPSTGPIGEYDLLVLDQRSPKASLRFFIVYSATGTHVVQAVNKRGSNNVPQFCCSGWVFRDIDTFLFTVSGPADVSVTIESEHQISLASTAI